MILVVNINYINFNFFLVKGKVNILYVFVLKWCFFIVYCVF